MISDNPVQWTSTSLRVRYAETDQMGVVYYANYLIWFEVGRTDLCRKLGFAYREMEREDGLYLIVAEARCRYKAPARYDDLLTIELWVAEMGGVRLTVGFRILNANGKLLADGVTRHICATTEERPKRLPKELIEMLRPFARDSE